MDLGLRETARQLKVDPSTIKKYAKRLGMQSQWENKYAKNSTYYKEENLKQHKDNLQLKQAEWLNFIKQYPDKSRSELRKLNPALYTWLYRNCKEWIQKNSPKRKEVVNCISRIDWEKRDNELLLRVKEVVKEIIDSEEKPERITISRVGSKLRIRALLEKHLSKLPRTQKYLKEKMESIKDFQIRRIEWAIKELIK